jgi:FtsP/CotA-like multicopper oxidase with cupredoxin domain
MTSTPLTRRTVLTGVLGMGAGALTLAACGTSERPVGAAAIAAADARRPRSGGTRAYRLVARPAQVDLGGRVVDTWTYGGALPGRLLRATAGDRIRVDFANQLPQETSVHWHGLGIRNDMDGVPHLTNQPVAPGGRFGFDFVVPDPGTYWFHPHTGLQLDRGLYAPFIIDDPREPGGHDAEWVVVLDDWTDGVGPSPEQIYSNLKRNGGSMGGMSMGDGPKGMGNPGNGARGMGGDGGDVAYPLYLVNGRPPTDPDVLRAKPGQRVRLRIINAAADTIFDVALAGHQLHVTHTDGRPVQPAAASSVRLGMGERSDAVVTLQDGVFPLVARPYGKPGLARALVRTANGSAPAAGLAPGELDGQPLTAMDLQAAPGSPLPRAEPATTQDVTLAGGMGSYVWTINGRTYDDTAPLTVHQGQTTRLRIRNASMMSHPLHVHGHTFQLGPAGGTGPRKDTVLVPPMAGLEVDLLADNPGRWMVHCHNAYHAEAGMMTRLDYLT